MKRRIFVQSAAACAAFGLAPSAVALSERGAEKLIGAALGDIQSAIDSGARGEELFARFEVIFREYADVAYITRGVLGRGVEADEKQIAEFSDAFVTYMSRKYGKWFEVIIGATLELERLVPLTKERYEARASANLRDFDPFEVTFLLHTRGGRDMFYNMEVEGVNVMLAERAELRRVLDGLGGDIDRLTAVIVKVE